MRTIPLTQCKVAFIDDEDFERLSVYKWHAARRKRTWYAERTIRINGKDVQIRMHQQVMDWQRGSGFFFDHEDGNGLNNQKYNLRKCTHSQNMAAMRLDSAGQASRFRGVTFDDSSRSLKVWRARIAINGRRKAIGRFHTEEAAALAYNLAAQRHFGEFARLNVL